MHFRLDQTGVLFWGHPVLDHGLVLFGLLQKKRDWEAAKTFDVLFDHFHEAGL